MSIDNDEGDHAQATAPGSKRPPRWPPNPSSWPTVQDVTEPPTEPPIEARLEAMELIRKIHVAADDARNASISRVTVDLLLRQISQWAEEAAALLGVDALDELDRRKRDEAAGD